MNKVSAKAVPQSDDKGPPSNAVHQQEEPWLNKIKMHVHYYFSEKNLQRDTWMQNELQGNYYNYLSSTNSSLSPF
jgi:hypothetical protein